MNCPVFEGYVRPARIFGNLYFVGTRPASTHIIDTGDGLILIDAGFPETLELVLSNIRAVGLDPADIRILLLSHGHYDHAGAAKELAALTGAKIYVGEGDLRMVTGEENSSLSELFGVRRMQGFTPDVLLADGDTVSLGNTDVLCLSTPGHTDGTMSFFFDVTDGQERYRAGMFGGAGTNTLTREFLFSHDLPLSHRERFFDSIEKLKREKVEIFLGNHVHNNDTEGKLIRREHGESHAFVSPDEWTTFLEERKARLCSLIQSEEKDMQETVNKIVSEKVIMIVRGVAPDKIEELAEAMWRGGIRLMECTYDATEKIPAEETAQMIAGLVKRFEGRMLIGAGTVLTKKQIALTAEVGGKFIVSPDTNAEIIRETKKAGLVSIPGALTPSEATEAWRAGADFVKLFPVSLGGGVKYVKTLCAPLSHIRFLAVGGVAVDTVRDYISSGASGVGMGLSEADRDAVESGNYGCIEEKCRNIVSRLK